MAKKIKTYLVIITGKSDCSMEVAEGSEFIIELTLK